jgi:4-hydroxy-3-methylbut-2-en-1-yl diphosphate synthase IspG/GcpE
VIPVRIVKHILNCMIQRPSRAVPIDNLFIDGDYPIRVQSMTNTRAQNVAIAFRHIRQFYKAQCEIV